MNYKVISIDENSHIISGSNIYASLHNHNKTICPTWKLTSSNETYLDTPGGGDACMNESFAIDGDLIITAGWGDGFSVRKIDDLGALTLKYHDNTPCNSYANVHCIALDKVRHIAYIGNYVYDNLAHYDYSDPDNVIKLATLTEAGDGLPSDEIGYAYYNGLGLAGDWLYFGSDDKASTQMMRWNTQTKVADNLPVINYASAGQTGCVYYDEDNNRMFCTWLANGEVWMTINPESDTLAKTYNIKINNLSMGNDVHFHMTVPDKDNPNHIWIGGYYGRFAKLDITDVLAETATVPTVITRHPLYYNDIFQNSPFRVAGYHHLRPHPTLKSDLIHLHPDRGYYRNIGWIDQENCVIVGQSINYMSAYKDKSAYEYRYESEPMLDFDYGGDFLPITSSDGSEFWVGNGYSGDGHRFRIWDKTAHPNGLCFNTTAEIIFGTYSLDDNSNIGDIKINGISQFTTLTNTSLSVYVSNNNGSTWELYDWEQEETHTMASTGYQARIKIMFTGTESKMPYYQSVDYMSILLSEKDKFNKQYSKKIGVMKRISGAR